MNEIVLRKHNKIKAYNNAFSCSGISGLYFFSGLKLSKTVSQSSPAQAGRGEQRLECVVAVQ